MSAEPAVTPAKSVVRELLRSDEPSLRWRTRVDVLGEDPDARTNRRLQDEIRRSPRARTLLENASSEAYRKWQGRHWVLLALSELGYPPGDDEVAPLAAAVVRTWLGERYYREWDPTVEYPADDPPKRPAVAVIDGRHRRCGSQQGAALLAICRLGFAGLGADRLIERLRHWQWPDGGWNCHRKPAAASSSVYETLLPMRGLAAAGASDLASRAGEVLLSRRVLFGRSDGRLIRTEWAKLHYPVYWHYDLLAGLVGLRGAGLVGDPRCRDSLDLLEHKQLPNGWWAADASYAHGIDLRRQHYELVDWGGVGRPDPWVTVGALSVRAAVDRI